MFKVQMMKFIMIGSKGASYLAHHHIDYHSQYVELNSTLDFKDVIRLVHELTKRYQNQEIASIQMIYTKFVNNLTFQSMCDGFIACSYTGF